MNVSNEPIRTVITYRAEEIRRLSVVRASACEPYCDGIGLLAPRIAVKPVTSYAISRPKLRSVTLFMSFVA